MRDRAVRGAPSRRARACATPGVGQTAGRPTRRRPWRADGAASRPHRSADVDLTVDLAPDDPASCVLRNPMLVASGTFGYGVEYGDVVDIERLGAICCKGTTLKPRFGNQPPRVTETPAGMLNSIGLQNPGVDAVHREVRLALGRAGRCRSSSTSPASRSRTTSRSCAGSTACRAWPASSSTSRAPTSARAGSSSRVDPDAAGAVTAAVRRATDLPLMVKLSPNVADVRGHRAGHRGRRRRLDQRHQHALGHGHRPRPPAAAAGQHVRRPVGAGHQAGRAARRLRGRPGRAHPDRGHRRRGHRSTTCSTS